MVPVRRESGGSLMLSVIVPTYNERQNVAPLVERIERALAGVPFTTLRRLASGTATLLARASLSRARLVSDPMSGFSVFRREVVCMERFEAGVTEWTHAVRGESDGF